MPASMGWAAISTSSVLNLEFGKFVAVSGGTVTIGPSGLREASGGVVLVPSSLGTAAQFLVSGTSRQTFAVSLPENGVVFLVSGRNRMPVNTFRSSLNLAGIGTLSAGGSQTFSVGATLSVDSGQASGSYTGSFDIIANYN